MQKGLGKGAGVWLGGGWVKGCPLPAPLANYTQHVCTVGQDGKDQHNRKWRLLGLSSLAQPSDRLLISFLTLRGTTISC